MSIREELKKIGWGYAIIEVILITIGILIAFEIDNWKESNKERQQEKKVLTEIKSSLEQDLEFLHRIIFPRMEEVINSSEVLLNHISLKHPYTDSINVHAFIITYGIEFEPRSSAFENLRIVGVDLISNDNLRLKIIDLYDFEYPRQLRIIDRVINDYRQQHLLPFVLGQLEYQIDIENEVLKRDENGKIVTNLIIPKHVYNDKEFFNILCSRYWHFNTNYSRLTSIEIKIQALIDEIEKELEK